MPLGYLLAVALVAACTAAAVLPVRRPSYPGYLLSFVVNEVPAVALTWLAVSTALVFWQGDVDSPGAWLAVVLAALTACGLVLVARRGFRAEAAVQRALDVALGPDRRAAPGRHRSRPRRWLHLAHTLLAPLVLPRRDVERVTDISYGDAGDRNLLDLYRPRSGTPSGPTLVYLHGGSFRRGRKSREAVALIHRLVGQGWVCLSATYRLSPAATFPAHLVDAKKVVAWARTHGPEYGANPDVIVVAGSSAGAHLAAFTALTPNVAALQPGFEEADTSVSAAVCLYGYFGPVAGGGGASSPAEHLRSDAPAFFVAHGDRDTLISADHARSFVDRLRRVSANPVVHVELPGAQHGFDLFRSVRFEAVVDGVEAFVAEVLPGRKRRRAPATGADRCIGRSSGTPAAP